jgi:hypothetical protein
MQADTEQDMRADDPAPGPDVPDADAAVLDAPALLRILWADPQHMAEHLAVWSLARFGPRASRALEKARREHPDADRPELERLVTVRQSRIAMTEGAFVGGPFIVLVPIAFCAALLAQAQLVYSLAGASGRDPEDAQRAADLLAILGAYPSAEEGAAAITALPRDSASREGKRLPRGSRWAMIVRMAYLLGVIGATDERSKLRGALGWFGVGVLFVVGLVLPLVWVPYMAYAMRKATLRVGRKAQAYYSTSVAGEAGVTVRGRAVQIGGTVALARTLLLFVVPIVVGVAALLSGLSFGNGKWIDSLLLLIAVSLLLTLGWVGYRSWRARRASRLATSAPLGDAAP